LYAGLGIGWNTIAERGTIPPAAHGMQDDLIFARPTTIQNERAMHASVSPDDKADPHPQIFVIELE
jgi:hypothetical protein